MTVLEDHQFEILPTEDSASGVPFGIKLPVSLTDSGFDPGVAEWITQDRDNPRNGSTMMGRDVRKGSTFTWALFVNQTDEETAAAKLQELADAWTGESVASVPGAYSVIRYGFAGRTRRVYGRPRRWANSFDNRVLSGMVPVTCDFQRVSPLFFDDQIEIDTLDMVNESEGGVTFPVTFPIISIPSGSNAGEIHVGGTRKTFPIIRITGPIVNPELITPAWTLKLNTTILEGNWIEIDTRPWVMTVRNQSGASVAGLLDPKVRLSSLLLSPGNQSLSLRGNSSTNTATCTIKRYAAHASF